MSAHWKGYAVVVALFLAAVLYRPAERLLALPSAVAVDASCEPKGWENEFRLAIHGRQFWAEQVKAVDRELHSLENFPRTLAELRRGEADAKQAVIRAFEDTYATNPSGRPSPSQAAAQRLRDKADEIEQRELDWQMIVSSRRTIQQLAACRPLLLERSAPR